MRGFRDTRRGGNEHRTRGVRSVLAPAIAGMSLAAIVAAANRVVGPGVSGPGSRDQLEHAGPCGARPDGGGDPAGAHRERIRSGQGRRRHGVAHPRRAQSVPALGRAARLGADRRRDSAGSRPETSGRCAGAGRFRPTGAGRSRPTGASRPRHTASGRAVTSAQHRSTEGRTTGRRHLRHRSDRRRAGSGDSHRRSNGRNPKHRTRHGPGRGPARDRDASRCGASAGAVDRRTESRHAEPDARRRTGHRHTRGRNAPEKDGAGAGREGSGARVSARNSRRRAGRGQYRDRVFPAETDAQAHDQAEVELCDPRLAPSPDGRGRPEAFQRDRRAS